MLLAPDLVNGYAGIRETPSIIAVKDISGSAVGAAAVPAVIGVQIGRIAGRGLFRIGFC